MIIHIDKRKILQYIFNCIAYVNNVIAFVRLCIFTDIYIRIDMAALLRTIDQIPWRVAERVAFYDAATLMPDNPR